MHAGRSVARLVAVAALAVALVAGCSNPGPGKPPKPPKPPKSTTTTTMPGESPVPGVARLKDFVARVEETPGGPRLVITGVVTVWSPAYVPRLVPAVPQGFNPRILLLRVVAERTDAIVPQVAVDRAVRLEVSPDYDRVDILDFDVSLPVGPP